MRQVAWSQPTFSRSEVNAASKVWLSPSSTSQEVQQALAIINNWRSSHAFPLNTFQMGLRRKGLKVSSDLIVAQRIKRLSSIELKLKIRPKMKLTQMQDLGGCRAILPDIIDVQELVALYRASGLKHSLLTIDDYISTPRVSGYRGVHLVYAYNSDKSETYNGLKIEMQLRSQLQHAWATSVEVVGMLVDQSLKSSLGDRGWLRFFQLMASELARRENSPLVPSTPNDWVDARQELLELIREYDPVMRLASYRLALDKIENSDVPGHFFILHIQPKKYALAITPFKKNQSAEANLEYLRIEELLNSDEGEEAVLVSVDSIAMLKRAYPNYFLDTEKFVEQINRLLDLGTKTPGF